MFDTILNNIIDRDIPMYIRNYISVALLFISLLSFRYMFRKKNDKKPIKIGWFIIFILTAILSFLYIYL